MTTTNTAVTTKDLLNEIIYLYSTTLEQCFSESEIVKTFHMIKDLQVWLKDKVSDSDIFNEITQFVFITNI